MRAQIFLAVVVMCIPSVAAADWERFQATGDGNTYFWDPARTRSQNGKSQIWVKVDASRNKGVNYRSQTQLWSYDCSARSMRLLTSVTYDSFGKVISSRSVPDYSYSVGYEAIIPETIGESGYSLACPS